jgi:hypothetical protein
VNDELTLSESLQAIARRYMAARRRSGEALLEAAQALHEAREEAQHGEWYTFLQATQTAPATAERLLNIHRLASQNLQFAGFVADNWIGLSSAALLARPSTPPEAIKAILSGTTPPSVDDVQHAIDDARSKPFEPMTRAEALATEARIVNDLYAMSAALRDVQARLTSAQLEQWLAGELQMDAETAGDFAAFAEGHGLTDRMLAYLGIPKN